MAARPPASPSPQARRQAQLLALQAALERRQPQGISGLLDQWVHRHGVSSQEQLWAELALVDPEGCQWWQEWGAAAQPAADCKPEPPALVKVPSSAASPAPAPRHPALVQLRSWLPDPDQESRRAA